MNDSEIIRVLSSIVLASAPLIIAVCGETLTERSGVINLSLDGTMLMAAMTGFVVAFTFGNVWLGFLAGAGITSEVLPSVSTVPLGVIPLSAPAIANPSGRRRASAMPSTAILSVIVGATDFSTPTSNPDRDGQI